MNENSNSLSSEDTQNISQREILSRGSSRCSSRDGMQGLNGNSIQDGVSGSEIRQPTQNGMLAVNGIPPQGAMSAQGELQLQQDENGPVQSRRRRTFTPEVSKDTTYWVKRRKNNEAARRSREKRRRYDLARERNVKDISSQNKYLLKQLCILKRRCGIPANEHIEITNEDPAQIDNDCRILYAAITSACPNSQNDLNGENPLLPALSNPNSMNGDSRSCFSLSPVESVTTEFSSKPLKSEHSQQLTNSCLKADTTPPLIIKQEPHEFENAATIIVNMARDSRRNFNTSPPSPWYPMDHAISGPVVSPSTTLTNGMNLVSHPHTSTPSPTYSSSSLNNYSMSNGHGISQLPSQQDDEPLQLTVNRRPRMDSDNSSEPAEDLQCDRNSHSRLSSPTANGNSHLPFKLRYKAKTSLPEHTFTHSVTPTTMISTTFSNSSSTNHSHSEAANFNHSEASNFTLSEAGNLNHSQVASFNHSEAADNFNHSEASGNFNHSDVTNFNHSQAANFSHPLTMMFNHSQANGLAHLSEVALSQNGPLPLVKRDINAPILHQRNGQSKENDNFSGNSVTENKKRPSSEVDTEPSCSTSNTYNNSSQLNNSETIARDPKYVEQRRRNNMAARKCRELRKTKYKMCEVQSTIMAEQNQQLKITIVQQKEQLRHLQMMIRKKQESAAIALLNNSPNNDNSDDDD